MADKLIEKRIREHYVADDGEWLVERGKVKEAKLLKEACLTIEELRRENFNLWNSYNKKSSSVWKKTEELAKREKAVEAAEKRLRDRINSAIEGLSYLYMKENL